MVNPYSSRKYVFTGIVILIGIIFLFRLFYLQVIDEHYKLDARNQTFRYLTDYPARGNIYDRNGKLLVYNEAAYDLMVLPRQVKNIDTLALCNLIGITKADFKKKMRKAVEKPNSPRKPSIFEKQLSAENYAVLQEKIFKFPGFYVQPRTLRKYPHPIAAHLLGYIGEVDKKRTQADPYYKDGDYIGISGIEKAYEKALRGIKGMRIVMVDVNNREKGKYKDGLYDTLATPGKNLTSTLDADLQIYGEQLMQNKKGSIVAIDPSTGEILVLVTSPSYDPNLLVGRVRSKNYVKLARDSVRVPLFNRALMATYPPGSTFKLVMALIGQQEKVLFTSTTYPCARGYPPMGGKPGCHPHASPLNFKQSIEQSCNSYYTYVFRSVIDNKKYHSTVEGFSAWKKYVLSFGIGKKLHTDLPNELRGSLPTVEYYNKYFGEGSWKSATILSLGIGQGEMGITPLQNANIVSIIANKGFFYTPHIIKYVGNNKQPLPQFMDKNYTLITDTTIYNNVIEGMSEVVESGTAAASKIEGINYCGKTGTAQNPHGKDHSVFVAFAPRENPKIAISVLVENAGFGSTWAAPIASLIIEKYLTGGTKRPEVEKRMMEGNLLESEHEKKKQ